MTKALKLLIITLFLTLYAPVTETTWAQEDDLPKYMNLMPKDTGRDLTYNLCSSCHSVLIVLHQGQNRHGWKDILTWMTEKQAMPALTKTDEEIVLNYLSKHYGKDRPNKPGKKKYRIKPAG